MNTNFTLDAITRQSLSTEEITEVERLIAEDDNSYESIVDVIADAREMLR